MRQITMRSSIRAWTGARFLPVVLCAMALTACGGQVNPGGPVISPAGTPAGSVLPRTSAAAAPGGATTPAGTAKVSLIIEVTPRPGAKTEHWTLRCQPTGGTEPDAAGACHQLLAASEPFAPVRRAMMCPMIAAGEQTAVIRGIWFGKPIYATFSQLSGCAAVRWRELGQVFDPVR
jgi:hypothetical protein